ncbi:hypothetical protein P9851_01575 [Geobacillus stearothermophilus]|uniref:hypothetical protein n=1 Tax=Geobacillus stearothermophilus TaxID=1422 RepID=UPI002E1CA509|nr:hypothetical protein [Geobacillus stearothermophilus]
MTIKRSLWLRLSTIQLIILFYLAAVAVSTGCYGCRLCISRVGIISFLWLVRGRAVKDSYHYPKERVIIG